MGTMSVFGITLCLTMWTSVHAEYYGKAHKDFQQLCLVLGLPGRYTGPAVDEFSQLWDYFVTMGGSKIFNTDNQAVMTTEAKEHCKIEGGRPEDDPKCAFLDLIRIGKLVRDDVSRLQGKLSSSITGGWFYYAHYIAAWFQHPRIEKLNCGPNLDHLWYFIGKISHLISYDEVSRMQLAFSSTTAVGLRQEINKYCAVWEEKEICKIRTWTKLADKIEALLDLYSDQTEWGLQSKAIYKDAVRIYFFGIKKYVKKFYPQIDLNDFLSTNDSQVKVWLRDAVLFINEKMRTNKPKTLMALVNLLPEPYELPCDLLAKYPSLEHSLCTFKTTLTPLKPFLKRFQTNEIKTGIIQRKYVSTDVNYVEFMKDFRFSQILDIGKETQFSLIKLTNYLKNEMQKGFNGVAKYFNTVSKFDESIARADVGYISGTLDKYKKQMKTVSDSLSSKVGKITAVAATVTATDLAEALLIQALKIAEDSNPIKVIVSGVAASEWVEKAQQVSQALARVTEAVALFKAFDNLVSKAKEYKSKLEQNEDFWLRVRAVVDNLNSNTASDDFEKIKEKFLASYSEYTPAATKQDIASLIKAWELLVDTGCGIIDGSIGIASGVAKATLAGLGTCPKAKILVQELGVIYEELYEFQFTLIDALVAQIRAQTSQFAANTITADFSIAGTEELTGNIFAELELLSLLSMTCYRISVSIAIEMECDRLEYLEGERPKECNGMGTTITNLVSRIAKPCHEVRKIKWIPTKPASVVDKAWINLESLYAGKSVVFKIPNSQWLVDKDWIENWDKETKYVVKEFIVYLPTKSYSKTTVRVTATVTALNQLSPPDGPDYVITSSAPLEASYEEGQYGTPCIQGEYVNPYKSYCNNMTNICPLSIAPTKLQAYPSIYGVWNIQLDSADKRYKKLSVPDTNIPLAANLLLCKIGGSTTASRRAISNIKRDKMLNRSRRSWKCCNGNTYLNFTSLTCHPCPAGSESKYGGLFCGRNLKMLLAPADQNYFTFSQAKQACIDDDGKKIASASDMTAAKSLGYSECNCGWLSDGSVQSPSPSSKCREALNRDTNKCEGQSTWDTYCVKNF